MATSLQGKRVAILATHGFEQSELEEPKKALEAAGAATEVISPEAGSIRGWKAKDWGAEVAVDRELRAATMHDYDALVLPGGVLNPDTLRTIPEATGFVRAFHEAGKPIAAICHGPWMLVEADIVRGRSITSWPSLRTDARNAGAKWIDAEVVVDAGMITSRKPADLPAFNKALLAAVAVPVQARAPMEKSGNDQQAGREAAL